MKSLMVTALTASVLLGISGCGKSDREMYQENLTSFGMGADEVAKEMANYDKLGDDDKVKYSCFAEMAVLLKSNPLAKSLGDEKIMEYAEKTFNGAKTVGHFKARIEYAHGEYDLKGGKSKFEKDYETLNACLAKMKMDDAAIEKERNKFMMADMFERGGMLESAQKQYEEIKARSLESDLIEDCLKGVKMVTKCPAMEREFYEKTIKMTVKALKQNAAGGLTESQIRDAVKQGIKQAAPMMEQMSEYDASTVRQALKTSIDMMPQ